VEFDLVFGEDHVVEHGADELLAVGEGLRLLTAINSGSSARG
jgi:hypothetical protein